MSALALPTRSLFRLPLSAASILPALSLRAALSLPSTSASTAAQPWAEESTTLVPGGIGARLRDLLPGWVFAVPKSKTTHSAKRMRSANKGLKERQNIVACPSCGAAKVSHHLCHDCHSAFRKELHQQARQDAAAREA